MFTLPPDYPSDISGAFGVLKTRKSLSIDDMRVLAVIEAAGEEFYLRVARAVRNPEAASLLIRNGREERGHAHRLLKAIVAAGGEPFELPAARDNPFIASLPHELPATVEFIRSLESGEQNGDRIYQAWADAAANKDVENVLRQNGREETQHAERDAQVIRLLAANA